MARFRGTGSTDEMRLRHEEVEALKKLNDTISRSFALSSSQKEGGGGALASLAGLAGLGSAVGAATAGLASMNSVVQSFVQKANPGAMLRFNVAVDDAQAVIGQRLTPLLNTQTEAVRLFGDFLQTVLPSADDFAAILEPINDFLGDLRDMLASIAPIIKDVLIVGLRALGEALRLVLWPFRVLAQFIKEAFGDPEEQRRVDQRKAAQLLPFGRGLFGSGLQSATGSAARSIRFEDPMSAARSVYQAAFQARGGPEEKKKSPLDKIDESIREAVDWLKDIFGADAPLGGLLREIAGVVKNIYTAVAPAVESAFDPDTGWGAQIGNKIGDILFPGNKGLPPADPDRARANDVYARAFGEASRKAQTIAMLPFGREQASDAVLKDILQELKKLGEAAGAKDIQGALDRILDQAKRRGIDGNSGGF